MNITTSITLNMQTPGYVVAYEPQGNKLSRFITATLKNGSASWSVPSGATAMIRVAKPDGTFAVYDKNEKGQPAYTISGSTVTIELVGAALAAAGDALVTVMFLDSTGSNLSPFSFRLIIMPSAVSDDKIASSDYFNIFQETLDRIQQMLTETQAMYGSPLTAATASAMTNTSKIYVYVGAESGYSYGHWYYYNGSAWVDGGIYNSEGINSNWLYEAFFTGTIENTSLAHFTDGADNVPVKALTVAIDPVQSGTGDPSPDNVRPISGWTGANVNVAGKNLWTFGDVTVQGVNQRITFDYPNPLGTFTISFEVDSTDTDSTKCAVICSYKDGTSSGTVLFDRNQRVSRTITATEQIKEFVFYSSNNYVHGTGDTAHFKNIKIEIGATATPFDGYGSAYPISFGSAGTVYGGTLDVVTGEFSTRPYYASYNGETLVGPWISSLDAYVPGSTPTIGAQVVDMGGAITSYQLTPTEVLTLLGENNIWADTGEIEELVYRADASLYLDSKISATKSIIAGIETNMVATKSYSIGDLLIVGDVLYKVASPIASGATFTPGTNVNATTVAEQLILLANS